MVSCAYTVLGQEGCHPYPVPGDFRSSSHAYISIHGHFNIPNDGPGHYSLHIGYYGDSVTVQDQILGVFSSTYRPIWAPA